MAKITVDSKVFEVDENKNLLDACLSLGLDLPYFCWHPAMGSVGACRQCAVKQYKDENDSRGMIVIACMTPVVDGARISIRDPEAVDFRARVIEWLMMNHPHDCPICDEGGECHLQDMTVMTGHNYRHYRFNKRTHRNQYLGPLINHEMNRCIECYRCVRYYRELAGGRDFDVFASHDHVYFGRHEDGILESPFSGNLVEICPTGVFTDKTLKKHYSRKWDLETAPSICVHCGLGCNTIPGERYGTLRRIRNRYNRQVNGYFLCDRGRYGYEFVNSESRIRYPLIKKDSTSELQTTTRAKALEHWADIEKTKVIGIGSPRASLEANFALQELVGRENFFSGISEKDAQLVSTAIEILKTGPARSASLHDVELADAVFVLGEDLTNSAPMLDFALRQSIRRKPMEIARKLRIWEWDDSAVREAIQQEKGPLFLATPAETKLDEIATDTFRGAPQDLARLGFAVAHALDSDSPSVTDLPDQTQSLVEEIAKYLREAENPLVISGLGCRSEAVIHAAANIVWALYRLGKKAQICLTSPECNSIGLGLLSKGNLQDALTTLEESGPATLVILENDLYRRSSGELVEELFKAANKVVVLDYLETPTTIKADMVFPVATFAEGDGTLINNEGRAQRYFQVFIPAGETRESWRWLRDMMFTEEHTQAKEWQNLDHVISALADEYPVLSRVKEIAPSAEFRIIEQKIPRQPHRYSGRTAMYANINISEPKPPEDPDSALSFSMEGTSEIPPAALIPRFWQPGWNSIQSLNKFQSEVAGSLIGGDPGIRLIEPPEISNSEYFKTIPPRFQSKDNQWEAVPLYHIFGSEELSVHSAGITELTPTPYLMVSPSSFQELTLNENEKVIVSLENQVVQLPIKISPSLPKGVAGISTGLPGVPNLDLPNWVTIRSISKSDDSE